ncbi:MAG: hypothetical protein K9L98_00280 [Candidatus Pacebacteria bacterium]|nr:hypothetical protein [Candidatus Paceibacterota bacterium]MCF7862439.1 hypothetical protein [Candidatus Paceibacterota bacterium]
MNHNKGFAPVLVLLIVFGLLSVGGVAYFAGKSSVSKNELNDSSNYSPTTNTNSPSTSTSNQSTRVASSVDISTTTNNQATSSSNTSLFTKCTNDKIGVSFEYPKGFLYDEDNQRRPNCLVVIPDEFGMLDAGKMIAGYLFSSATPPRFVMFIGGATKNASFGGELNASDVTKYPDANDIKSWNERGYKTEKKVNRNNQEYILVHGQPETEMPYLSENSLLAIFKLKSSKDFPAIGFQLVGGDKDIFNKIIDSVEVF